MFCLRAQEEEDEEEEEDLLVQGHQSKLRNMSECVIFTVLNISGSLTQAVCVFRVLSHHRSQGRAEDAFAFKLRGKRGEKQICYLTEGMSRLHG